MYTKVIKKGLLLFIIIGWSTCVFAAKRNSSYINPTPGEISIIVCSPVSEGVEATSSLYQDVMDCGFNLVSQMASMQFYKQQFELIGNLKLKFLVSNDLLRMHGQEWFVNDLKNSRYLGGWMLKDEPRFDDLKELAEYYQLLQKLDPNHLIIINLVGILHKSFTGNYKTLSAYYNYVETLIHPQIWSYDFYPIIGEKGKLIVDYDNFFQDLELFYSISRKTNTPFWSFCETLQYTTKTYYRPAATEAFLNFEAFSALAYGAQGIAYWTYGMRESNAEETYISALVDSKGEKTPAWFAAQKVNRNIKKFNEVFYQCNVKRVRHTGDKLYKGTKKLSGKIGPFRKIESSESGVLISEIENNGKNYIVIVNHDVFKNQKIILDLSPGRSVKDISSDVERSYQESKSIVLNLDKGGYVIFQEV